MIRLTTFLSVLMVAALTLWAVRDARAAEDLVSGLSTDLIEIRSNFTGTDIVLFGAVESSDGFDLPGGRDIVVVIRGPATNLTVRRKDRVAGIWINREQVAFSGLPGFYFLASTKPLTEIAPARTLQLFELGTANLAATAPANVPALQGRAFQTAAIGAEKHAGVYWESASGIDFLSRSLFRARIPVPASVPPGQYLAQVYLFRDGSVVSAQSTPFYIDKSGLERWLYNLAYNNSLAYGLAAVMMAFVLGWLGYVLFRRGE